MPRDDSAPGTEAAAAGGRPFAAVVDEHWSRVYRFLFCTLGDPHDAEDLTQETFLRAWRRLDTLRLEGSPRVWLLRIAANAARDLGRRRRRVVFQALEHDPPVAAQGPEHRLEVAEQSALLEAALSGLSELTRMVFHLRVQEDLPFREVAELAGTTEQSARWHMHQARTKLLKQLAEKP